MEKYQCRFIAKFGAYSMEKYDLPTDNEEEIINILTDEGWEVLEVYNIKNQQDMSDYDREPYQDLVYQKPCQFCGEDTDKDFCSKSCMKAFFND